MRINRLLADVKDGGDLLRGLAFRDQLQDLALASGERPVFRCGACWHGLAVIVENASRNLGAEIYFPPGNGANCQDQLLKRRVFYDVA